MQSLNLDELKVVREGLECALVTSNRDLVKSAIEKVDEMLAKEGLQYQRKAFQNEWKKLNKTKIT